LRHSFITNQLEAGTPIHVVRDLAGHHSIATTQLYAHASNEARRAAMERCRFRRLLGRFLMLQNGLVTPTVTPKEIPQTLSLRDH